MNKRSIKFYRKNEAEIMKRIGLKPTKNSGAGWVEKADGENEHFLCELKSTDKESFSIKQKVLQTLEYHASVAHKIPLFVFQFLNKDEVWLCIKESDVKTYKDILRKEIIKELLGEEYFKTFETKDNSEKVLDNQEDMVYNKTVQSNRDFTKMCRTREKFYEQCKKEREQQEEEFKNRIKERRATTWKRNSSKKG